MDKLEKQLQRTWLQLLLDNKYTEIAALVMDADLKVIYGNWGAEGMFIDLPTSAYSIATNEQKIQQIIYESLNSLCKGYLFDQNGNFIEELRIEIRIKLLELEENWKEVVRDLIVNSKNANQGTVTEKLFARGNKEVFLYNEMKFGSHSEIRIAQEFEKRKVLFFPLPLAVRNETGKMFLDHREVDFLVCVDGVWGILEVSYHPDRFEKDAEKDSWFKKSGILCVSSIIRQKDVITSHGK